nr:hypothetical protein [uncultured Acetobacterium sp.]
MKRIKKLRDFILINNMLSITIPLILVGLLITPLIYNYLIKDIILAAPLIILNWKNVLIRWDNVRSQLTEPSQLPENIT